MMFAKYSSREAYEDAVCNFPADDDCPCESCALYRDDNRKGQE